MKRILIPALMMTLAGCSSEPEFRLPHLQGRPEVVQLATSSWPKLLQHCPGLNKYQGDLSFVRLADTVNPITEGLSRVELVFKVSMKPEKIPSSYLVYGHTCAYGISADGSSIRIQKGMCVSVCLDVDHIHLKDYVANL